MAVSMIPALAFAEDGNAESQMTTDDSASVESTTSVQVSSTSESSLETVQITGTCNYSYAYSVLKLVNEERNAAGLSSLKMDEDLLAAAMQRAAEISLYFDHTRPSGESCFTVSSKAFAENIAAGYATASAVMDGWMDSSGHKANILGSSYKSIGIGCFTHNGVTYWVQLFGTETPDTFTQPSNSSKTVSVDLEPELFSSAMYLSASASSINVGKSTTVKSRITNLGWSDVYAELKSSSLKWSSSNTSVATVSSSGKVTAKGVGSAKITATTSNGNVKASKTIKVTLATPSISKVSNTSSGVKVTWAKVSGANGYYVYRSTSKSGTYKKIATIKSGSTVSYTNKTSGNYKVTAGKRYYYKVVAYSGSTTSSKSAAKTIIRLTSGKLTSVKNSASGKMTVRWSKRSGVSGYQIQYSTSSTFAKGNKTIKVSGASKSSKVISKLTKGKTYYVRVRTYKTSSSTTYYSGWSSTKKIKISK